MFAVFFVSVIVLGTIKAVLPADRVYVQSEQGYCREGDIIGYTDDVLEVCKKDIKVEVDNEQN